MPNPYAQFRGLKPAAVLDGGIFVYEGHYNVHQAAEMVRSIYGK